MGPRATVEVRVEVLRREALEELAQPWMGGDSGERIAFQPLGRFE
jgi:hypothetical protein